MFHYVLIALASQKERSHRLIILWLWNIISSRVSSLFYSFRMLDVRRKVWVNVQTLEGVF